MTSVLVGQYYYQFITVSGGDGEQDGATSFLIATMAIDPVMADPQPLSMPRRSRPAPEPDLFSLEPALAARAPPQEPPAAIVPDASRSLDVGDVARAIATWSDEEVEQLRIMATEEAQRRGLPSVHPMHSPPAAADVARPAARAVQRRKPEDLAQAIGPGQVSAIRAASQSGMRPGKIAQTFGLSLAIIKRILNTSASA